jgi:hypothetical protein
MISMLMISFTKLGSTAEDQKWYATQMICVFVITLASMQKVEERNKAHRNIEKWIIIVGSILGIVESRDLRSIVCAVFLIITSIISNRQG